MKTKRRGTPTRSQAEALSLWAEQHAIEPGEDWTAFKAEVDMASEAIDIAVLSTPTAREAAWMFAMALSLKVSSEDIPLLLAAFTPDHK